MNADTIKLVSGYFPGKASSTIKAYASDLDSFADYLATPSTAGALDLFFSLPESQANLIVLHYKSELLAAGEKTASVNRRLSTIRSLTKVAYKSNVISWIVDIANEVPVHNSEPSVLSKNEIHKLFKASLSQPNSFKAARDYAMMRLMYDLALKRNFVSNLELSDLDLKNKTLKLRNPVRNELSLKKLPPEVLKAMRRWIRERGKKAGKLFTNLDVARKKEGNLSSTSIYRIVHQLGKTVGIKVTPEEIRKAAIADVVKQATALGYSKWDILAFSDHKQPSSLKNFQKQKINTQLSLSSLISESDD